MGGPDNTFQWSFGETVVANSSMLTRQNVTAADGGSYVCMVTNDGGTDTATTSVFIAPYFVSQPQDVRGANGTSVTLACQAEAFPSPTYQWSRIDGRMIRTEVMGQDSEMLMFAPLMFGDEGNYFCTAMSSQISLPSQNVTLTGKSAHLSTTPPVFADCHDSYHTVSPAGSVSVTPALVNSSQGNMETLMCTAQGGPGNTFTWTKLDNPTFTSMTANVTITVMAASDGGVYQCLVMNSAGNDTAQTTLTGKMSHSVVPQV